MKNLLMLCLLLKVSTGWANTQDNGQYVCSVSYLMFSNIISDAHKHSSRDKNKHCAISCMLTLRCNSVEVFEVGVIKEIIDFFGPGNMEFEDIKADYDGINIGRNLYFSNQISDELCFHHCDQIYHP